MTMAATVTLRDTSSDRSRAGFPRALGTVGIRHLGHLRYDQVVPVLDVHQRPLRNLRLSVTDRCNLRCQYCMPEADYLWLPREDILQFEEIDRLVDQFLTLGVDKVRLTGGEPLLRRDLPDLVARLAAKPAHSRPGA